MHPLYYRINPMVPLTLRMKNKSPSNVSLSLPMCTDSMPISLEIYVHFFCMRDASDLIGLKFLFAFLNAWHEISNSMMMQKKLCFAHMLAWRMALYSLHFLVREREFCSLFYIFSHITIIHSVANVSFDFQSFFFV